MSDVEFSREEYEYALEAVRVPKPGEPDEFAALVEAPSTPETDNPPLLKTLAPSGIGNEIRAGLEYSTKKSIPRTGGSTP